MSRATQFEIIAEAGAERVSVGYSRIKSREGIARCIQRRAGFIVENLGIPRDTVCRDGRGCITAGRWVFRYSGETLRDNLHREESK